MWWVRGGGCGELRGGGCGGLRDERFFVIGCISNC